MSSSDQLYLQNILDAVETVETYVKDLDLEEFKKTKLVQDGVIRQITIMGEATKLVSKEVRSKYTEVPWQQIARMRDMLMHRYFGVNLDEVWLVTQEDLPPLKTNVKRILDELKKEAEAQDDEER